ncbi:UDP-glucose/GDP-mannose dehydrogenase family protein [Streptomyces sp. PSKA54]|uniref:UDP-glucose 6-dehydrogenase n=1 Tax=Streptomyces himalayensis subsp. aureolus TaxID=2758039 RepID=A0A7W2HEC6_9ACTN|nr:UDP-glucose/GDP-mannose dehydrogenase family protein [Streptomyces himalayensis]MBA4860732.1 UDP-glucose/GDP-mannose dehydrogenase family protein [Streptomyces himalayensis subsp. aureolus]
MRIAVVGQGYVGLTGSVAMAQQGHDVMGIERDPERLRVLERGEAPLFEPGVAEQLALALAGGRLRFAAEMSQEHRREPFDAVLIAVGTPAAPGGAADLSHVDAALEDVARLVPVPFVVLKSTVPPGTSDALVARHPELRDRFAYNPEFLNQGSALDDWLTPARLVVGVYSEHHLDVLRRLYGSVACPWVVTSPASAEMTKYASNAFLATKISFANELARLCSLPGLDVDDVLRGMGFDPRIGHAFLQPGLGFGDSCLPKDTAALSRWAAEQGVPTPLLDATIQVNTEQPRVVAQILQETLGSDLARSEIAVLGVRYQPWTDDVRAAPSLTVIPHLAAQAGAVRVWDPAIPPARLTEFFPDATPCTDLETAVNGANAVVVLTEWPEVIEADWVALAGVLAAPRAVIDGKNCLLPDRMAAAPVVYRSIGNRYPHTTNVASPLAPQTGARVVGP